VTDETQEGRPQQVMPTKKGKPLVVPVPTRGDLACPEADAAVADRQALWRHLQRPCSCDARRTEITPAVADGDEPAPDEIGLRVKID
jgi:hypothetical protein